MFLTNKTTFVESVRHADVTVVDDDDDFDNDDADAVRDEPFI